MQFNLKVTEYGLTARKLHALAVLTEKVAWVANAGKNSYSFSTDE